MKDSAEFIVFSDLHAHNFPYRARRVPIPGFKGLYNSRLADTVAVLDEIGDYAAVNNVRTILFGGDLFHRRSSISTDVRHVVVSKLIELAVRNQIYMITGNHDLGDRKGYVHNLCGLEQLENIHVFNDVGVAHPGSFKLICVPYTDNIQEAKARLKRAGELCTEGKNAREHVVLLAHLGMQGATVGSDYVLVGDSDIQVSDVPVDAFSACFFGHFHEHQVLFKNGWFIGATHEQNWSDSGGSRGFLHVKIKKDGYVDIKQIQTKAPKFVLCKEGTKFPAIKSNDFVKCITKNASNSVKQRLMEQLQVDDLEVVTEAEQQENITLSLDKLDSSSMLKAWVKANAVDGVSENTLVQKGLELLAQVEG
jgi:DNA repair exonuclease SbcCD nuclease subunit